MYRPLGRTTPTEDVLYALKTFPPGNFPKGAHTWQNFQDALKQLVREFVMNSSVPETTGEGRGIVTCGGGTKYFPSVYAQLRRLRDVGCLLPVEVWHLGPAEMDPSMRHILADLGARTVDAVALSNAIPWRILNGWELKPYSMLYSQFQEVLFLDADCTPVRNPTYLFDNEDYQDTGAILWPDYTSWTLEPWIWDVFDLPKPPPKLGGEALVDRKCTAITYGMEMPEGYDPPIESGQLLVNKGLVWRALRLAGFLCEFSDLTFRYVYGDKEMFRFAWKLMKQRYHLPKKLPGWDLHTIFQYCPERGETLFLHRVQDKLTLNAVGNRAGASIPDEDKLFTYVKDLASIWGGTPWKNNRPTITEAIAKQHLVGSVEYRNGGEEPKTIELRKDGIIERGTEYEQAWSVFDSDGAVTLGILDNNGLTATLTADEEGVWRGCWINDERSGVEIVKTKTSGSSSNRNLEMEKDMRQICMHVATNRSVHEEARKTAAKNTAHYARSLSECFPSATIQGLAIKDLPDMPELTNFSPMNPSIAVGTGSDDDAGILCNVRFVNYEMIGNTFKLHSKSGTSITRNVLVKFDPDLTPISCWELEDHSAPTEAGAMRWPLARVQGFEDCRLFFCRDRWWASATVLDRNPTGRAQIAILELAQHRGELAVAQIHIQKFGSDRHQKNWVPLVRGDELFFIYESDPTTTLSFNFETTQCEVLFKKVPTLALQGLRGSSQAIPFAMPDTSGLPRDEADASGLPRDEADASGLPRIGVPVLGDGWLYVAHEAFDTPEGRQYTHRLVWMNQNLDIMNVSEPFYFLRPGIEFCAGLALVGSKLIFSFGVQDARAYLASVEKEDVLRFLQKGV